MRIKPILALLLLCCILLTALGQNKPAPQPQQPPDDQEDVIKISTNLVQVDVVVTKDGKMVTDLTADDFEIFEDGRKQTITNFAYISNVPTSAPEPAANTAKKNKDAVVPYVPVKPTDPRRIMAFVVDDLGIAWENIPLVKRQLRKFINEQMAPNDLVAIIRTGGELGVLQQFTNDKRLLMRAVDRLRWNSCNRVGIHTFAPVGSSAGNICGSRSYDLTLAALGFIVDSMGYLPGRKSLVLLSDSMPVETQEFESFGAGPLAAGTTRDERLTLGQYSENVYGALQRVAERAIRSSVVIYSVETFGLVNTGISAADPFPLGTRQVWGGVQGTPETGPQQTARLISERNQVLWDRRLGGDQIARQTGGFQIRNSNSYDFDRILRDQSGYYLLGYRPSEETFNRKFHHIKAKVKRSGMSLRTRFGFIGVTEEEAKRVKPTPRSVANLALASPFAAQDIEVDLTSFFADDKNSGSVVRSFVYVDPKDLTFTRADGRYHTTLELYGVVFGDNGVIVEQRADSATLNLSDADYEQITRDGIGIGFDMPAKRPGVYQVRVVARDKASSKIGSAGQYMAVPDLKKKQQLAVSGVVLGTLNPDKTIAKSGVRRFPSGSDLYYAYNLYNVTDESGNQRDLVMDVMLFRDGKIVQTVPEVAIGAPDGDRVFVGGTLRLAPELEPGHYHLQVLVRNRNVKQKGPAVAQWADFELEKK